MLILSFYHVVKVICKLKNPKKIVETLKPLTKIYTVQTSCFEGIVVFLVIYLNTSLKSV